MRSKDTFHEWAKEAYGEEIKSVTELFKPKVVNVKPEKTLSALIDFLQKGSSSLEDLPADQCKIEDL